MNSSLLKFYNTLPQADKSIFRFFEKDDYTCVGDDATKLSEIYFNSDSVLKTHEDLKYSTFNKNMFEQIVKYLLTDQHHIIELYQFKNASWCLKGKASPGNFGVFEDLMSEANSPISNSLCTINFCRDENYGIKFGLAVVCLDDFSIQVCEFFDDSSFASLESNLLLLNPKECICINGSSDMKLQKIADNCKILLTNIKKSDNSTSSLAKDLDTLLNAQNSDMDIIKNLDSLVLIKPCTSAIIQMLNLLGSEDNQKRFSLRRYIPTDFMRLDSAAISALNLFPEDKSSNASSKTCILNLINKTITSSGSKLIHKWVHQPLMSVDKINERLDIVEIFSTNLQILNLLRKDHLPSFPNIDLIIRKLVTNRSSLKDCYKLYVGFKRLGMLIESLKECEHDKIDVLQNKFIKPLEVLNVKILKFIEMIECTLDFNKIKDNEFNISGSFNNELESLDNELKSIRYKIDQEFNLTSKELYNGASKNLKLEYNSDQKFFMRVSLKEEKLLRNRASFIIIEVNKSGVKFINNNIQNLNHNYFETSETFNKLQESIIKEILDIAKQYIDCCSDISQVISELDAMLSLASYNISSPSVLKRPTLCDSTEGIIEIRDMKHPILERLLDGCVIPNDIKLSKTDKYFNVITGPNMGGKSTFIRTVAILVYMSQIGCFLPCSFAKICVVDAILFRIGAGDSLSKGISTFMAEMLDTCSILRNATNKSLVIVDELGRGTSTYDGFGLTWSIANYLHDNLQCFCLFATHFHEMTDLSIKCKYASNFFAKAVEDSQGLTMLYRIVPGVCKQSFGCNVARITGFPEHVITDCITYSSQYEFFQSETSNESEKIQQYTENYLARLKRASERSDEDLLSEFNSIKDEMASHELPQFRKTLEVSKMQKNI